MVKVLQLFILSIFTYINADCQLRTVRSQVKERQKDSTYYEVESSFPGGYSEWEKYLNRHLNANVPIVNNAPSGKYKVTIKFFISKNGLVDSVEALTHFGYGMESEFIRVLKNSPKWLPAQKKEQPIISYQIQSIEFIVP